MGEKKQTIAIHLDTGLFRGHFEHFSLRNNASNGTGLHIGMSICFHMYCRGWHARDE